MKNTYEEIVEIVGNILEVNRHQNGDICPESKHAAAQTVELFMENKIREAFFHKGEFDPDKVEAEVLPMDRPRIAHTGLGNVSEKVVTAAKGIQSTIEILGLGSPGGY